MLIVPKFDHQIGFKNILSQMKQQSKQIFIIQKALMILNEFDKIKLFRN